MRAVAALLLLCLPSLAFAQDMTWRWEDHEVRSYRIQTYMQFRPGEVRLAAGKNLDARVEDIALGLETDCRSVASSRRAMELECVINKAEMGLGAAGADQANADEIAAEYTALLAVARVQLELTREGRIKTVDVEGIPKNTEREGARHEMLRLMVARAFGGLEIELPKDGDTRGEPWEQGGLPMVMRLPVTSGTVGKAKVIHAVEHVVDGVVTIQTHGDGSAQSGRELSAAAAGQGTARVVEVVIVGTARFNEQEGYLVSNEYRIQGQLTASGAVAGDSFFLTQVGLVEYVADWDAEAKAKEAAAEMAADEARAVEAAAAPAAPAQTAEPAPDVVP